MLNKIVEINNQTDFRTLMLNANCETKLHRVGTTLDYFKIKKDKKWVKLVSGDRLLVDSDWNLKIIE